MDIGGVIAQEKRVVDFLSNMNDDAFLKLKSCSRLLINRVAFIMSAYDNLTSYEVCELLADELSDEHREDFCVLCWYLTEHLNKDFGYV